MNLEEISNKKIINACNNIGIIIKHAEISAVTLSKIIGENERYFTRVLSDKPERKLTLQAIIKIATLFNYSLDMLCSETEDFYKVFKNDKTTLNEKEIQRIRNRIKPFIDKN